MSTGTKGADRLLYASQDIPGKKQYEGQEHFCPQPTNPTKVRQDFSIPLEHEIAPLVEDADNPSVAEVSLEP